MFMHMVRFNQIVHCNWVVLHSKLETNIARSLEQNLQHLMPQYLGTNTNTNKAGHFLIQSHVHSNITSCGP